jgi:hypothetical protein
MCRNFKHVTETTMVLTHLKESNVKESNTLKKLLSNTLKEPVLFLRIFVCSQSGYHP